MESLSRFFHIILWACIPLGLMIVVAVIFFINNRPPAISVPTPVTPLDNGWRDFVKAGEMLSKSGHTDLSDVDTWTLPKCESFVQKNAPVYALIRSGLSKPYLHPPVRNTVDLSVDLLSGARNLARSLAAEARNYELRGEPGKAADCLLDCVELGVTLPKGGVLITGLVGLAIESIGIHFLLPVIPQLNKEELAQVAVRIEQIQSKRVPYADIMREEAYCSAAMMQSTLRDPKELRRIANPKRWLTEDYAGMPSSPDAELFWYHAKYAFTNKAAIVREDYEYFLEAAKEQTGPYTGQSSIPMPKSPYSLAAVNVAHFRTSFVKNEAILTLLQVEVALRRNIAENNTYPASLSELTPTYLKKIPDDPFGLGKPFNYKASAGGTQFLLYSLGPNMKDDGGTPGKWEGRSSPGDIVAGISYTR